MKKIAVAFALSAATFACAVAAQVPAEAWQIGPVIRGRNSSVGMPPTLQPSKDGPFFNFPQRDGSVHYVSLATRPLQGARTITVRYRVDARPGVRFIANANGLEGLVGLVFHRAGDTWSAKGRYEAYRWYSPEAVPLSPGVHTMSVMLDDPNWVAVYGTKPAANPDGFAAALANTEMVSLTFGGVGGRGHGVYATGPARFTILSFDIR
jgi:hypothetical protein